MAFENERGLEAPSPMALINGPLQILNLAVMVIPSLLFLAILEKLPDQVPAHYNASGVVDRWGSPHEQWLFLGLMLFDYALMWAVVATVARERWILPEEQRQRYAGLQFRRRALIVRMMEAIMFGVNGSFAVIWLGIAMASMPGQGYLMSWAGIGGTLLMILSVILPLIVLIGPMVRVQKQIKEIGGSGALGTRADGWKSGGMLYYAPDDPAVFVPKKIGIGQTLNFARPAAWIFIAGILVLPLLITFGIILLAD